MDVWWRAVAVADYEEECPPLKVHRFYIEYEIIKTYI